MSLLQQAILLLTEAPGNTIYHLVTLFALQVIFAVSFGHWQRDKTDRLAARMVWAAASIFLARLGLLLAGLLLQNDPLTAVTTWAPIEQAVHTITIVFLVWTFIPASTRYPKLGYALLLLTLGIVLVMTFSFTQSWRGPDDASGAYNGSGQGTVWGIWQLVLLGLGIVFVLAYRRPRFSLPAIILGILLIAHVAHFWNYPELITTNTNIPYYIRLGHLIAFPLWAAFAYRHALTPLLQAHKVQDLTANQVSQSLNLASNVIGSLKTESAVEPAIEMAAKLTDVDFVGLALFTEWDGGQLYLASNQILSSQDGLRDWYLNLVDWPAFRQSLNQCHPVILTPEGVGARQLHDWYKEIGIEPIGALLIQPLITGNKAIGLLLLAGPIDGDAWRETDKMLAESLASYLARAIENGRYFTKTMPQVATVVDGSIESESIISGRIIALKEERDKFQAELKTTTNRMQQAETSAAIASKQARDLAATLNEIEHTSRDEKIEALEMEIEALRESLIEAEEAMALAAASEGELSSEWVMHTITRYSGQLEEAQARIQSLEEELLHWEQGPVSEVFLSLVQELRTPMTSIGGYTDLLLAEQIGILGDKQRDAVQRVQANIIRMSSLMDQLVQLTTAVSPAAMITTEDNTNVEEVIETAVSSVLAHIREKNLRMEMDIVPDLPSLPLNPNVLRQILTSLLGNACQTSPNDSRIKITVRADWLSRETTVSENGDSEPFPFLHLAVTDSGGGIRADDRARVFNPQLTADSPLIAGLGDTGAALSVARALAEANRGRIWVDSLMGVGSTFSALFPLSTDPGFDSDETAISKNGKGGS